MGVLDWRLLDIVKNELGLIKWYKSLFFSYLSFVGILWVTGPLFSLYNSIKDIVIESDPIMPTSALVIVLSVGLITRSISSIGWTRRRVKTTTTIG
jgi:hypothetical protein